MLVHIRDIPQHLIYTLVKRATVRVKYLAQEHNTSLAWAQNWTVQSRAQRTDH